MSRTQRFSRTPGKIWEASGEAAMPARKSSESPGKKKPINSPVSAKMIARTPITPNVEISSEALNGLIASTWATACVSTANTVPAGGGMPGSAVLLVVQGNHPGLLQRVCLVDLEPAVDLVRSQRRVGRQPLLDRVGLWGLQAELGRSG